MNFISLSENFGGGSDPFSHWLKSKVKLDLVEEVILDLEYDNHLGRLTDIEKELLDTCAHSLAECFFPTDRGRPIQGVAGSIFKCTPEMNALFWSRFEEKLDEKLAVCGITDENTEPVFLHSDLDAQKKKNDQLWQKVCLQVSELTQVLQDACAIHKDLTGRRGAYQKSLLLTLGKTLGKEAQHLASRADRVETQIHQLLLQPSKRADDLKTAYNDLVKEKEEVEQKVSDLDGLLQAYLANEKKFIELANAKADAERQLLVLQGINDAGPICHQRLPGRRRSFSMTTLELDENEGRKFVATDF